MSPPKTFISFPSPRLSRYQRSGFNLTQRSHETSLGTVESTKVVGKWKSFPATDRTVPLSWILLHDKNFLWPTKLSLQSICHTLEQDFWMLFQETEKTSHLPVLTLANIQTVTSTLGQELFPLALASGFAASPPTTSKTNVHCLVQS